jgi:hypothetical protein
MGATRVSCTLAWSLCAKDALVLMCAAGLGLSLLTGFCFSLSRAADVTSVALAGMKSDYKTSYRWLARCEVVSQYGSLSAV